MNWIKSELTKKIRSYENNLEFVTIRNINIPEGWTTKKKKK